MSSATMILNDQVTESQIGYDKNGNKVYIIKSTIEIFVLGFILHFVLLTQKKRGKLVSFRYVKEQVDPSMKNFIHFYN